MDQEHIAERLAQAIELGLGAPEVHGLTLQLAESLGAENSDHMSPGGMALYLVALLIANRR